jgi:hypothetical protein
MLATRASMTGSNSLSRLQRRVPPLSQRFSFTQGTFRMRPEIQTQLDNAKQSIGLLRRHL